MPNWYSKIKDKAKQIAAPAALLAPLMLNPAPAAGERPLGMTETKEVVEEPMAVGPRAGNMEEEMERDMGGATPTTQPAVGDINVKKIIQMESSGRARAESPVGASGLMQVMPKTWEDIAQKIGKYQGFEQYKFDEQANVAIGSFYMNTEIPRMLKTLKLPDSVDMRLACYNFGIGNVQKLYQKHPKDWQSHLPTETANYLKRYRS